MPNKLGCGEKRCNKRLHAWVVAVGCERWERSWTHGDDEGIIVLLWREFSAGPRKASCSAFAIAIAIFNEHQVCGVDEVGRDVPKPTDP